MAADVSDSKIKSIWGKYRLLIIAIIIVVIIGLGIALIVYYGKNSKSAGVNQGVRNVIATIPNTDPNDPYSQDDLLLIGQLATQQENNMSGFWWKATFDNTAVAALRTQSDKVLLGVWKQYKQDRPSQDLITDLQSLEYLWGLGGDRDAVVTRLNGLI